MIRDLHFWEDARDLSFLINNEGRPFDTHVLFAVHGFLFPHAVVFDHFLFRIGQQWKIQLELALNFLCDSTESALTPNTTAPRSRMSSRPSRKLQASVVHPGVSSFG